MDTVEAARRAHRLCVAELRARADGDLPAAERIRAQRWRLGQELEFTKLLRREPSLTSEDIEKLCELLRQVATDIVAARRDRLG